jgi:septal ring factor EnvC (AmiA/AmiB activator)
MIGIKKSLPLLCVMLLCLPWAVLPQEFTPIYENLDRLDGIMTELQNSNEVMIKDNESLNSALETLNELLQEQGRLLNEQAEASREMREISGRQAALLGSYISRSRILTVSLTVGIPLAAGAGLLAGWLISR